MPEPFVLIGPERSGGFQRRGVGTRVFFLAENDMVSVALALGPVAWPRHATKQGYARASLCALAGLVGWLGFNVYVGTRKMQYQKKTQHYAFESSTLGYKESQPLTRARKQDN